MENKYRKATIKSLYWLLPQRPIYMDKLLFFAPDFEKNGPNLWQKKRILLFYARFPFITNLYPYYFIYFDFPSIKQELNIVTPKQALKAYLRGRTCVPPSTLLACRHVCWTWAHYRDTWNEKKCRHYNKKWHFHTNYYSNITPS